MRYLVLVKKESYDAVKIAIAVKKNLSVYLLAPRINTIGVDASEDDRAMIRAIPGVVEVEEEGDNHATKK